MLKITIEIIPWGKWELKKVIGTMSIVNDGSGTIEKGNYTYTCCDEKNNIIYGGIHKNFLRKRGFWQLMKEIFKHLPCD
jgi:hypothetical protein